MFWFKDKNKINRDRLAVQVNADVEKHNIEREKALADVNKKIDALNETIKKNGFTLTIRVVIQGRH